MNINPNNYSKHLLTEYSTQSNVCQTISTQATSNGNKAGSSLAPACSTETAPRDATALPRKEIIRNLAEALSAQTEKGKPVIGIIPDHLIKLQELAEEYNCVIGIRAVDPLATGLITAGHPTKNIHIKGKTASWGPQAGLICKDQSYSKLETSPKKTIAFSEQVRRTIRDGYVNSIKLALTPTRLQDLVKIGSIQHTESTTKTSCVYSKSPSGKNYYFATTLQPNGHYAVSLDGKPIKVLSTEADNIKKMLTADYDLLCIGPHISDYGSQDNLPIPDVAHEIFLSRAKKYKNIPTSLKPYLSEDYFYASANKDLGNISSRVRDLIPVINQKLVPQGEKLIHHGEDAHNAFTDIKSNYPATFFLPRTLGQFQEICLISNNTELAELIQISKDEGYQIPINPLWDKPLTSIRRKSFLHAQSALEVAQQTPACISAHK
jgi:hypothetical protein